MLQISLALEQMSQIPMPFLSISILFKCCGNGGIHIGLEPIVSDFCLNLSIYIIQ